MRAAPCADHKFEPVCDPAALWCTARTEKASDLVADHGHKPGMNMSRMRVANGPKPWATRNRERDACLTSGRRVGRRHPRHVAVSIACLDPIAVCARWPPSFSAVRGSNVSSVWCHDDDGDRDRIVNSKRGRHRRARLKSASADAEILALLRSQSVQFLYGAVRLRIHGQCQRLDTRQVASTKSLAVPHSNSPR